MTPTWVVVAAIGKYVGASPRGRPLAPAAPDGRPELLAGGTFHLSPATEAALIAYLRETELYASATPPDGVFKPAVDYPPHERAVELGIDSAWAAPSPR